MKLRITHTCKWVRPTLCPHQQHNLLDFHCFAFTADVIEVSKRRDAAQLFLLPISTLHHSCAAISIQA